MDPTSHELAEVFYWNREAMATDMGMYMTLLFGYLVLVYFVGNKLDKAEAILISVLYSAFSFFLLLGLLSAVGNLIETGQKMGRLAEYSDAVYVGPVTIFLSWVLSIWYMSRVRR